MLRLLPDESRTILAWFQQLDLDALKLFLGQAGGPPIDTFSSVYKKVPAIGVDFIGWLHHEENIFKAPVLLSTGAKVLGANPAGPPLCAIADRIRRGLKKQAAQAPHRAHLARGIPIVNRTRLRDNLERILSDEGPNVMEVRGDSGLGRTHSWYLIHHVASLKERKAVRIDIVTPVPDTGEGRKKSKIEDVFEQMVSELGLKKTKPPPTVQGVSATTLAARYSPVVARLIRERKGAQAWLVFDELDKRVEPEIKAFVKQLAEIQLRDPMGDSILFLLGPGPDLKIDDPFECVECETLTQFLDSEIEAAARGVNELGDRPLSEADLCERIEEMKRLAADSPGPASCVQISKKLVGLRKEVAA